jgi:hypothetical protein
VRRPGLAWRNIYQCVTNTMEQSPSWEFDRRSAGQKMSRQWNTKFHNCVRKSPPLDPISRQENVVRTITPYVMKIHFNIILPRPHLPSGFLFRFSD